MQQYYSNIKLSPTMTRIDSSSESAYLIEGQHSAVLIDSCSGAGRLDEYVRQLTNLPVILALTHGHVDHIGGAMCFEERYLNEKDWELAQTHGSYAARYDRLCGNPEDPVSPEDVMPEQVEGFLPLRDGQTFDLGGVHLTAISLPGHTQGSMVILHREERRMILGDACNSLTFMFFPGMPSIEEYQRNLTAFRRKWYDAFDYVHFSHFEQAEKSIVDENIRVCQDIMNGNADDIPLNIPLAKTAATQPYIAKAIVGHPKERRRADGKKGNIVYTKDNIWLPKK